jgi:hypothetical protein
LFFTNLVQIPRAINRTKIERSYLSVNQQQTTSILLDLKQALIRKGIVVLVH